MITIDIQQKDIGYRDSPLAVSFLRMYGKSLPGENDWRLVIGRDNGILYEVSGDGWTLQFPLSPDAWCYNLMWHRTKTAQPDPCLFLTEKPLFRLLQSYRSNRHEAIPDIT